MSVRWLSFFTFLAVVALVVGFLRFHHRAPLAIQPAPALAIARPSPAALAIPTPTPSAPTPIPAAVETPVDNGMGVSLAADLNQPGGEIARDLEMLNNVLNDWRVNFPGNGNPVGDNVDITRALTGENSLRLPLIPRAHRAINSDGELCDRWGTPFRFHALSGTRMEIRSAGPDKKFGTADDSLLTPP